MLFCCVRRDQEASDQGRGRQRGGLPPDQGAPAGVADRERPLGLLGHPRRWAAAARTTRQACLDNAAKFGFMDKVEVIYLQAAIDGGLAGMAKGTPVTKTSESRKGGSIHYGLNHAAGKDVGGKQHAVCYTDADLSTHMGQSGLLLDILVNQGKKCAVGSAPRCMMGDHGEVRRAGGAREAARLLLEADDAGDGAHRRHPDRVQGLRRRRRQGGDRGRVHQPPMAFDIELLIKCAKAFGGETLGQAGIAWKDSEALSTSGDSSGYVKLLQQMVDIYRQYLPQEPWREDFGEFLYALDDAAFERLLKNCPAGIADRDARDYTSPDSVTTADLRAACGL
ncbi:unnamed protein product [Heterosigma akashiwo]